MLIDPPLAGRSPIQRDGKKLIRRNLITASTALFTPAADPLVFACTFLRLFVSNIC